MDYICRLRTSEPDDWFAKVKIGGLLISFMQVLYMSFRIGAYEIRPSEVPRCIAHGLGHAGFFMDKLITPLSLDVLIDPDPYKRAHDAAFPSGTYEIVHRTR